MEYADYDYYIDDYKGSLSFSLFSSNILKASKQIDKNINVTLTQEIIDILSEKDQDKLQYATCEMVDLVYAYNTITTTASGLTSLSIDGVSKTYKSAEELKRELGIKQREIVEGLPQELMRYI
ncbi:MAG: hypothetical protein WC343_09215 [Bacilli bacterium]|jgi:hypothetical protein